MRVSLRSFNNLSLTIQLVKINLQTLLLYHRTRLTLRITIFDHTQSTKINSTIRMVVTNVLWSFRVSLLSVRA